MSVVLLLLLPRLSAAVRTVSTDKPVIVRLEVGQPVSVAFPETLEKVGVPLEFDGQGKVSEYQSLSADKYGPFLLLVANDPSVNKRLFVYGKGGTQYMVVCKVATPADDMLYVQPPQAVAANVPAFDEASFLRALRLNTPLPGAQQVADGGPLISDSRIAVLASVTRTVGAMMGTTLLLRNTSALPLTLDLRHLE